MTSTEKVKDFLDQLKFSKDLEKSSQVDGEQNLPGDTLYKTPTEYEIEKLCGQYKSIENEARKIIRDNQKVIFEKQDNLKLYPSKLPNLKYIEMSVKTKIDSWNIQNKARYQEALLERKKYAREAPDMPPLIKRKEKPQDWKNFLAMALSICGVEALLNIIVLKKGMEPIDAFILSLFFSVLVIAPTWILASSFKKATTRHLKNLYISITLIWAYYINLLIALVRTDINNQLSNQLSPVIKTQIQLSEIIFPWIKAINPSSFFEIKGVDPYLLICFGLGSAGFIWWKIQKQVQSLDEVLQDNSDSYSEKFRLLEKEIKDEFNKILMDEEPNFKQCGTEIEDLMEDIRASEQLINIEEDNLAYLIQSTRSNFKLMISDSRQINMIHRRTKPPEHWSSSDDIDTSWIKLDDVPHITIGKPELHETVKKLNEEIKKLEIEWSGMKNTHSKELANTLNQWAEEANQKIMEI